MAGSEGRGERRKGRRGDSDFTMLPTAMPELRKLVPAYDLVPVLDHDETDHHCRHKRSALRRAGPARRHAHGHRLDGQAVRGPGRQADVLFRAAGGRGRRAVVRADPQRGAAGTARRPALGAGEIGQACRACLLPGPHAACCWPRSPCRCASDSPFCPIRPSAAWPSCWEPRRRWSTGDSPGCVAWSPSWRRSPSFLRRCTCLRIADVATVVPPRGRRHPRPVRAGNPVPLIMLVFDEFSGTSLRRWRRHGSTRRCIRTSPRWPARRPGSAMPAAWPAETEAALPGILTGNLPQAGHPRDGLARVSPTISLRCWARATSSRSSSRARTSARKSSAGSRRPWGPGTRLKSLLIDAAVLDAILILPQHWPRGDARRFGARSAISPGTADSEEPDPYYRRREILEEFIDGMRPGTGPGLFFIALRLAPWPVDLSAVGQAIQPGGPAAADSRLQPVRLGHPRGSTGRRTAGSTIRWSWRRPSSATCCKCSLSIGNWDGCCGT